MLVGGAAPHVLYAIVHLHLPDLRALTLAALFPAVVEIASVAGHSRLAPLSTLNLIGIGVALASAALWTSPQLLAVRASVITGTIGITFLVSLLLRRPATFYVARQLVAGN